MLLVGIATAFTIISIAPAGAGGSWLDPSWVRVEVGDRIELSGSVSHGQLGWINDGPFYAYLQGETYGQVIAGGAGGGSTDVPLGELTINSQSNHLVVSIEFTLEDDVPPGEYWIVICNDPCTTGLGDLIGGVLYVGVDPPPVEEEVTAVSPEPRGISASSIAVIADDDNAATLQRSIAYMALSPHPDRSSGLSPMWIVISMAMAGTVLLTALLTRQNSGNG